MPLDPFFAERLRVHRRYLVGKTVKDLRALGSTALWNIERGSLPHPRRRHGRLTGLARPCEAPPRSARVGSHGTRDRRNARARSCASVSTKCRYPAIRPFASASITRRRRTDRCRRVSPSSAGPSASAASTIRRRMPHAGVVPRTPASRWSRSTTPWRPSTAIPTQVEQAHAALEWLFEHAEELGVDAGRIGVAGTSAGGNIAAALTLMNRDRGRLPLRLQVLEVPVARPDRPAPRTARDPCPRHPEL